MDILAKDYEFGPGLLHDRIIMITGATDGTIVYQTEAAVPVVIHKTF